MNKKEIERMRNDIKQIVAPVQSAVITKHYCFSFLSFLISNMKPDIQKILECVEKFEEVREELQILRLNRSLNHCPNPECEQFDFCFGDCDLEVDGDE